MTGLGMGATSLAMLLTSFGGLGLPLGLPPEAENPAMAYVAPEECLFYASWASMAAADPQSKNHTEQLLADEEVRRFAATLERAIALSFQASRRDPRAVPRAEPPGELVPICVRALVTRSTAVFVEDIEMSERELKIRGGLLVEAGDQASAIVDSLAEFLSSQQRPAQPISLGKVTGHRLAAGPGGPPVELTFASAGPYVLVGVGEQSLEGMLKRLAAKKAPSWHAEIGKRLPVERRASISYVNAPVLLDKLLPLGGPSAAKFGDAIGLKQIGEVIGVVGLDDDGMVSRSLVKLNGPPSGFVKLLEGDGIEAQDLEFLPRDALFATAVTLNAEEAFELLKQSMAANSPDGATSFERFNADFEREFKLRLSKDVLAALGDVWTISASSVDGWMGTVATVEVKDRETINSFANVLVRSATGKPVEVMKYGEFEIHSPVGRNELVRPAWCVAEKRLIIGLSTQAVKSALAATKEEQGLFEEPRLSKSLDGEGKIVAVGYQDTGKIFESVYGYVPVLLRAMQMNMHGSRGASDFNALNWVSHYLPSARAIHRHLQPSVSVTRLTKDGIETESHSTIPMPNIGANAPLVVALMLPAAQAAHLASQRTESSNNLKQILLALHNYHDTFGHLPPAYRFDKDKQPGLSWRVMILPFIEQQELYNQFRMDEPWDSEHNKPLIAKMPKVYRSPASKAGEGKTVYLGVSGKDGMFPPPTPAAERNSPQMGLRFSAVRDGLSNTIAVVEANDESAVIWTKPDDFTPDADNPLKGLVGLHPNGFQVALMDGSVRFVSENVDPVTLIRLFSRDDGNPVDINVPRNAPVGAAPATPRPPRPAPPMLPLPEGVPAVDEVPLPR